MSNTRGMVDELNFKGKVVSFSSTENTLAMSNIRFETQSERLFVVGIVPKGATTNDWAEGLACAVAWDSVLDYMVFDSEAQYVELMEKSEM